MLMTVVNPDEPDEVYEYSRDGQSRLFGRDDVACDIPIWGAINGTDLSRVAGRIWRMDGQLWVRNLSRSHELELFTPERPPRTLLATRSDDPHDPGPARSVPAPLTHVRGPGTLHLIIEQRGLGVTLPDPGLDDVLTTRLMPVPSGLMPTAAALCAPLLDGAVLPSSYRSVAAAVGHKSIKRARLDVERLMLFYEESAPQLRVQHERKLQRRERDLSQPPVDAGDPPEVRTEAVALPESFELATLLVRYGVATKAHVAALAAGPSGRPVAVSGALR